jgi:hypothetical protein
MTRLERDAIIFQVRQEKHIKINRKIFTWTRIAMPQGNMQRRFHSSLIWTMYNHSSVICQTTGPQPVIIISNLSYDRSTASHHHQ